MRNTYIKIDSVDEGMFSSEREVSFITDGRKITLIVDAADLADERLMRVVVVDRTKEQALIDLPREPFGASARLFVPTNALVEQ